ncbi:FAD-dependent oxidoreductase [Hutsoniella sourekii]|uniref:FAD-dependent oxidoreductase n=1 Tax=Hutsoniella sourekii TaxID=87650 RepID=UPI00048813F3|nr:FAD-dependent oxidoreductase [Hutsoniella sourekii]
MTIANKDYYDVVVVGTGASGMAAAVEAAQNNLSVLLLEKGKTTGGSTNYTEGMFGIDSYLQQEAGVEISKTEVLKSEIEYSNYRADAGIWRDYIEGSADTIAWMRDLGVNFLRVQAMGAGIVSWHIYEGFGDQVIHETFVPQAEKLGVELLTLTAGKEVILGSDGQVEAIVIEDQQSKESQKIQTSAVVLATGGYLDNPEMIREYTHYDSERLLPVTSGKSTGDGLQMAWQVGGKNYGTGTALLFGGYLNDPDAPNYEMMTSEMCVAAGQQPLLWVNEVGERFVDEGVIYNFSEAGNALYTQNKVYSILDKGIIDYMAQEGNFMGLGVYINRGHKMTKLQEEIDQAIEAGKSFIAKADSIEELAEKINLPKDKLVKTIQDYNQAAKSGEDDQFGKDPAYLHPVEEGPFYAFELGVGAFASMGGIKVNRQNQVLTDDGQVITGLYAVGNDASGLVGDTYGPDKPGSCVGYAFYSGRNAAQQIIKERN